MPLSTRFRKRQERFIEVVNNYHATPPVFKFDLAFEHIILVEAPSFFIDDLIEAGARLFLKRDGLIVEFTEPIENA